MNNVTNRQCLYFVFLVSKPTVSKHWTDIAAFSCKAAGHLQAPWKQLPACFIYSTPVQPVSLRYTWKANNSGMTPIQYTLGWHWSGLSYRQHLTKMAGKLQSRNNLLMKLAGSSWGANANTLRSSALALCYSVTEYCCPVWQCSTHVSLVDAQLQG